MWPNHSLWSWCFVCLLAPRGLLASLGLVVAGGLLPIIHCLHQVLGVLHTGGVPTPGLGWAGHLSSFYVIVPLFLDVWLGSAPYKWLTMLFWSIGFHWMGFLWFRAPVQSGSAVGRLAIILFRRSRCWLFLMVQVLFHSWLVAMLG